MDGHDNAYSTPFSRFLVTLLQHLGLNLEAVFGEAFNKRLTQTRWRQEATSKLLRWNIILQECKSSIGKEDTGHFNRSAYILRIRSKRVLTLIQTTIISHSRESVLRSFFLGVSNSTILYMVAAGNSLVRTFSRLQHPLLDDRSDESKQQEDLAQHQSEVDDHAVEWRVDTEVLRVPEVWSVEVRSAKQTPRALDDGNVRDAADKGGKRAEERDLPNTENASVPWRASGSLRSWNGRMSEGFRALGHLREREMIHDTQCTRQCTA